ncbi:MAG: hypothetical protein IKB38_03700 [Clostridia bacterium]|nr:hypothetical protein [Clostridia bacterium]
MSKTKKIILFIITIVVVAIVTACSSFLYIFVNSSDVSTIGRIEHDQNRFKQELISEGVLDEESFTSWISADWTYEYGTLKIEKNDLVATLYIEAHVDEYIVDLSFLKNSSAEITNEDKLFVTQVIECAKVVFENDKFSADMLEAKYDKGYLIENFDSNCVQEESFKACYLKVLNDDSALESAPVYYKYKTVMHTDKIVLKECSIQYTQKVSEDFYEEVN